MATVTRILVVDDTQDNIELLRADLEDTGFQVISATDGQNGIAQAVAERPDCILLDYRMPGMDGIETCKRLRKHPDTRDIPIIMLSAENDEQTIVAGLAAGAVDFISKPLSFPLVRARISTALRVAKAMHEVARERAKALKANQDKSLFFIDLSKEFRAPLQGIMGMAEELLERNIDEQNNDAASIVVDCGMRLEHLIANVTDLVQLEQGKVHLENDLVSLPLVVDEVVSAVWELARRNRVELIVDCRTNGVDVCLSDHKRLRQVLVNLTSNAVRHSRRTEVILRLETSPDKRSLLFEIKDRGKGMDRRQRTRAFMPFYREDADGLGLGLTIAKFLVQAMGSKISVTSKPGAGSTFSFALPLDKDPDREFLPHEGTTVPTNELYDCLVATQNRRLADSIFHTENLRCGAFAGVDALIGNEKPRLAIIDQHHSHFNELLAELRNIMQLKRIYILAWTKPSMCDGKQLIWLPKPYRPWILRPLLAGAAWEPPTKRIAKQAMAPIKGGNVLIVEDDATNAKVLESLLQRLEIGFDVVKSGDAAVEAVDSADKYDLILMDCQLPTMNGFEATEHIRRQFDDSDLPIVALTAHSLEEDRQRALQAGMNDFISKPVRYRALYATLRRWLKK